ncbi:hypothetical protein EBR21_00870 [bacterium]|nr:hypothetical protein [bacterium]
MKKNALFVAFGVLFVAPVTVSLAASNKDRIGLGTRKAESQTPQASETKQYCTDTNAKVQPGKGKERSQDDNQGQVCQTNPVTRSPDEVRAETRKVEREPNN